MKYSASRYRGKVKFEVAMTTATMLALLLLTGCAATRVSPEDDIRALEQRLVTQAVSGDRAALERVFAPEFRLVNPAGAIATRAELLTMLTGGAAPYRSAVYETQIFQDHGDTVVTVGLESVVPTQGAQSGQTVQRRITHVWQRAGNAWVLALRHATIVTPPVAAPAPAPR